MRGWTIPRLVETKHIKHRILRVGNGALFCSLKYISSAFRHCAGGSFFLPSGSLVRRLFSFHFPGAGWLREFNKNPKKEPHMANRNTNPGGSESVDSGGCGYIGLRACNGEVGRVGRVRRVGQWFHEFHLKSFAKAIFHREMLSP